MNSYIRLVTFSLIHLLLACDRSPPHTPGKAHGSDGEASTEGHLTEDTCSDNDICASSVSNDANHHDDEPSESELESMRRHVLPNPIFFHPGTPRPTPSGVQALDLAASALPEVADAVRQNGGEIALGVACDARTTSNKELLLSRTRSIEKYFHNLGLASKLFRKIELAPYQEETILFAEENLPSDSCVTVVLLTDK